MGLLKGFHVTRDWPFLICHDDDDDMVSSILFVQKPQQLMSDELIPFAVNTVYKRSRYRL